MARRPSVFVRPLSMDEGRALQKITRTAKDPVRLRRVIVVMMSGEGQTFRGQTVRGCGDALSSNRTPQ